MKTMKLLAAAAMALFMAGCATPSGPVDPSDTTMAVKNANRMSSSDWVVITQNAGNELLTSPLFQEFLDAFKIDADAAVKEAEKKELKLSAREKLAMSKPVLMLSTIQNNTGEHIDSRLLTERLREILFNSGKVRFTTYAAGEGQSIDAATAGARQLIYDPNIKRITLATQNSVIAYNLSLAGTIIKQTATAGRMNEISYMFSLTLTDNSTGEGVWAYTKEIKRQNKQGVFGW